METISRNVYNRKLQLKLNLKTGFKNQILFWKLCKKHKTDYTSIAKDWAQRSISKYDLEKVTSYYPYRMEVPKLIQITIISRSIKVDVSEYFTYTKG